MKPAHDIAFYASPLGVLRLQGDGAAITEIAFAEDAGKPSGAAALPPYLKRCTEQLDEYFAGKRTSFDLPLSAEGTDFQRHVWKELSAIPYGKTRSYGDVARRMTKEKAVRAVGQANNRNPHCIVVPCHRVIGGDGSLTGYAGGLWRKEWLLAHERKST